MNLDSNISRPVVGLFGDASQHSPGWHLGPSWYGFGRPGETATVRIFGEIGIGAPVEDLIEALASAKSIELFINTAGGDSISAIKLYGALAGRVGTCTIVEKCFSAGVFVACSAKKIRIEAGARLMIHPASDFVFGQAAELRHRADCLDMTNAQLERILSQRSCRAAELMSGVDFYFSASEALAAGLVDEIFTVELQPAKIQAAHDQQTAEVEPAMTDAEKLLHHFLDAFGPLPVGSYKNFVRAVNAWACHNAHEV